MSVSTPQLTIIIVTHNSGKVIQACLESISNLGVATTTCIIDNASEDDTISSAMSAGVRVVQSGGNLGFARAANIGADSSSSDIFCFLNPDCLLTPDAVRLGVEAVLNDHRVVAVPDFLHDDGSIVSGRQPGYTRRKLFVDILETSGKAKLARVIKKTMGVDDNSWHWPLCACVFISKKFFESLGKFDERFFLYMEDVQLGLSVRDAGGQVISLGTKVEHLGGKSTNVPLSKRTMFLDKARVTYARFHYGAIFSTFLSRLSRVSNSATSVSGS